MSQLILGQNKIILHINLSEQLLSKKPKNPFININQLIIIGYHYQYTCIFYEQIYNHFKYLLPNYVNLKPTHIRIKHK